MELNTVQLADVPPDLFSALSSVEESIKKEPAKFVLDGVCKGRRDEAVFKYACRLREKKLTDAEIKRLVLEAASNCIPPFPEAEALKKVESALKYKRDGRETFKFVRVGELLIKAIEWLIKGLIEEGSTNEVFGDPGTYKSFIALAWSCCIASGKAFLGRAVKQGPVVYIAGEGQNGILRRILAWCIRNQVEIKSLPLFVSLMPVGLSDSDQLEFVKAALDELSEQYGNPILIVIDTLARNFGGGDENSTQDMTRFVEAVDTLRVNYNSTVLIVHHTGHSNKERSRGAMALKAALDSEFRLDVDETGVIRMECTKMKDAEMPKPIAFKPAVVELGLNDDDGNPMTSAVLEETEYTPPPKTGKEGRGKWQKVAVNVLNNLYTEYKNNLSAGGFSESTARVTTDELRKACMERGMSREAWRRIKNNPPNGIIIKHGFADFK